MKVLALDQSSRITGWAVFEDGQLIDYGKFNAENSASELAKRLNFIRNKVSELITKYEINQLLVEDIQLQNNVGNNVVTYKALAEVIGVVTELAVSIELPYKLIPSATWKSKLSIKGRARADQKRAAQQWVKTTYDKSPTQDECDAICIGASYFISDCAF